MNFIKIVLLIAGTLLFLDALFLAFSSNFNIGYILSMILAVMLVLYGVFFKKLRRWQNICIFALMGFGMSLIIFIAVYGSTDNVSYTEDAVIVLGAGIRGEEVTSLLAYRLDKAVEYCNVNNNVIIIVSGGQGAQETITEALAMERYLISKGIPQERIIKEEKATSTYENLVYSKELLDNYFKGEYKSVLITSGFHIYRATMMAESLGIECTHYSADIKLVTVPVNYLRECAAVLREWVFGR